MSLDRIAEYIDGIPVTDGEVLLGQLMCLHFDNLGNTRDLIEILGMEEVRSVADLTAALDALLALRRMEAQQ
jgi:hypothetical protein